MAEIATVRIKHAGFPDGLIINEADFVAGEHQVFGTPDEPTDGKQPDPAGDEGQAQAGEAPKDDAPKVSRATRKAQAQVAPAQE